MTVVAAVNVDAAIDAYRGVRSTLRSAPDVLARWFHHGDQLPVVLVSEHFDQSGLTLTEDEETITIALVRAWLDGWNDTP